MDYVINSLWGLWRLTYSLWEDNFIWLLPSILAWFIAKLSPFQLLQNNFPWIGSRAKDRISTVELSITVATISPSNVQTRTWLLVARDELTNMFSEIQSIAKPVGCSMPVMKNKINFFSWNTNDTSYGHYKYKTYYEHYEKSQINVLMNQAAWIIKSTPTLIQSHLPAILASLSIQSLS